MDVRSFLFVNGQEVVAELVQVTGTGYKIKSPLVAHMMRGPDGKPQLGFAPLSMIQKDDQEIALYAHALLAEPAELEEPIVQSYIQQTTGLIVPPQPSGSILLS